MDETIMALRMPSKILLSGVLVASKKPPRTEVIVAIIGLIGVLGTAVIANWEKIVRPKPPDGPTSSKIAPVNKLTPQPSISDPQACLTEFLQSVPNDRITTLENGTYDQQIIGPHQSKDEAIALRLEENKEYVGAIKLQFYSNNAMFKIDSVVDSECQPVESFENRSRGGDKHVIQNYDELEIRFKRGVYALRFGYDAGRINVNFTRAS
jgi:hypothetical protein